MIAPSDAATEIDEFSIGAPAGVAREQIPALGKVLHLSTLGGHSIDINCSPVVLFGRDYGIQTLLPVKHDALAVGRERRRTVIEAVVGQSGDLFINRYRPKIGTLVSVLVSLMRVSFDHQGGAIGTPRSRLNIYP